MPISEYVPLVEAGATRRNVVVGLLYFLLSPILLALLPLYLLLAVTLDWHGLATRLADSPLSVVPGIGRGGWRAGFTVFGISVFVLLGILGFVATGGFGWLGGSGDAAPATPTPTPSPDGTVTATPVPTATPGTVPDEYNVSGVGNGTTDAFWVAGRWNDQGFASFEMAHEGNGTFQVDLVDTDGTHVERLVDSRGEYNGTVVRNVTSSRYRLEVTADGEWEGTIHQHNFQGEDLLELPASESDRYHGWVGPVRVENSIVVSVTTEGEGNVSVWAASIVGERLELIAEGTAPYERTTSFSSEEGETPDRLLLVDANHANWTIDVDQG